MRHPIPRRSSVIVALAAATALAGLAPSAASATLPSLPSTPERVLVRTEGKTSTLFEGPVLSRGHDLQSESDDTVRRCDSTNNGHTPTPGPTPTAATVDGMSLSGEDFDGNWYPGFDDYFITRFGPDLEDGDAGAWWGVLVNGEYTPVGGCQFPMQPDDIVIWTYDAFSGRPFLRLDGPTGQGELTATPADGDPRPEIRSVFTVDLNTPLEATVRSSDSGYDPQHGITVAPVDTAPNGAQTVLTGDPAAKTSAADGTVELRWSTPGWKRVKAESNGYVRSNRLDVCVRDAAGHDCGPLPADVDVREPGRVAFGATTVDFGTVTVGTSAATQTVTLANPDVVPREVSAIHLGGTDADAFRIADEDCSVAPVPARGTCIVTVELDPATVGSRTAELVADLVDDRAAASAATAATVALTGTVAPVPPVVPPVVPDVPSTPSVPDVPGPGIPVVTLPSTDNARPQIGAIGRANRRTDARGRVTVAVRCPRSAGAAGCRTTVALRAKVGRRTVTAGRATVVVRPGAIRTLRITPPAKVRSALRRGTVRVTATTTTRFSDAVPTSVRRTTQSVRHTAPRGGSA